MLCFVRLIMLCSAINAFVCPDTPNGLLPPYSPISRTSPMLSGMCLFDSVVIVVRTCPIQLLRLVLKTLTSRLKLWLTPLTRQVTLGVKQA